MANVPSIDSSARELLQKAHGFELSNRAYPSVHKDSFYKYAAPQDKCRAGLQPGDLLKVERETDTSRYTLPPNLSLSRFIYVSRSSSGTLLPVSAYILWPYIATQLHPPSTGYPVVAWAHGTSGVSPECAPSNVKNLWHHFQAPYQLALNGYVVVATDYAGLGVSVGFDNEAITHEYLTGPAQAEDVLNSIPAALAAFPELSQDFVIVGSSQGGMAAWSCAEKLEQNPMNGYLGTVSLSPVTRLLDLPQTPDITPLLVIMLTPSLQMANPEFHPSDILSPEGTEIFNAYMRYEGCTTVLYNLPVGSSTLKPGWESNAAILKYHEIAKAGRKAFAGPMLVMTGDADPIISPASVVDSVTDTARMFPEKNLEFCLMPDVSHAPVMYSGWQIYHKWIQDRFARRPLPAGYRNNSIQPVRPATAQRVEANWYVQELTASWQRS